VGISLTSNWIAPQWQRPLTGMEASLDVGSSHPATPMRPPRCHQRPFGIDFRPRIRIFRAS
jgi:hypothetical protein